MGAFSLPTGDFELLMKKGGSEPKWTSVMFTDALYNSEIADCVERWSVNNTVLGARYNGRAVTIPTNYHWELKFKGGEMTGHYTTRKEAEAAMKELKAKRRTDKTIRIGFPTFVQD